MTSGGRELVKWFALLLMTGDHVNKVLLHGSAPWLSDAARVVFPLFAAVLAWNVVAAGEGSRNRAIVRLLVAGALVQPLHALAFGYALPLNILLTLGLGLLVAFGRVWWTVPAWIVGGLFVDYQWAGVGVVLGGAVLANSGGRAGGWAVFAASLLALCWFNGNGWALLALPMLWMLSRYRADVPRWRWTFLGYYVLHLAVLAALA